MDGHKCKAEKWQPQKIDKNMRRSLWGCEEINCGWGKFIEDEGVEGTLNSFKIFIGFEPWKPSKISKFPLKKSQISQTFKALNLIDVSIVTCHNFLSLLPQGFAPYSTLKSITKFYTILSYKIFHPFRNIISLTFYFLWLDSVPSGGHSHICYVVKLFLMHS